MHVRSCTGRAAGSWLMKKTRRKPSLDFLVAGLVISFLMVCKTFAMLLFVDVISFLSPSRFRNLFCSLYPRPWPGRLSFRVLVTFVSSLFNRTARHCPFLKLSNSLCWSQQLVCVHYDSHSDFPFVVCERYEPAMCLLLHVAPDVVLADIDWPDKSSLAHTTTFSVQKTHYIEIDQKLAHNLSHKLFQSKL